MHVGFYYHIEAVFDDESSVRVPSHVGLQIAEVAKQAGRVTFYTHEGRATEVHDFLLADPRIRVVNLGPRRRAPALTFHPGPSLRNFRPQQDGIDVMLIRGPSALLPGLRRRCGEIPTALQLVGDFSNWTPQTFFSWWRNRLIRIWIDYYQRQQERAARQSLVLLKSAGIRTGSGAPYPNSVVCFTTSLTEEAVRRTPLANPEWPDEKGRSKPIRLLYTGRIVKDKGLFEAVDALASLRNRGRNMVLHLVGWSADKDPTAIHLADHGRALGVEEDIVFGGYVSAGEELQAVYAGADIFVLPTYAEGGVAKSIIEAMGAGLPVVTSAIPTVEDMLVDGGNALLVPVASSTALAAAIERLVVDRNLRVKIAANGRRWAETQTVERSTSQVLKQLDSWILKRKAAATSR